MKMCEIEQILEHCHTHECKKCDYARQCRLLDKFHIHNLKSIVFKDLTPVQKLLIRETPYMGKAKLKKGDKR